MAVTLFDCNLTDSARTVCGVAVCNGTVSVRLSVPAWAYCRRFAAVDPAARNIDRLLQQRLANVGRTTLAAYVVAEHRLVIVISMRADYEQNT